MTTITKAKETSGFSFTVENVVANSIPEANKIAAQVLAESDDKIARKATVSGVVGANDDRTVWAVLAVYSRPSRRS